MKQLDVWVILFLLVLPFLFMENFYFNQIYYSLFALLPLLILKLIKQHQITFSLIDIGVILLFGLNILNSVYILKFQIDSLYYFKWLVFIIIYLLARNFDKRKIFSLLYAIVISGTLQSVIGLLQYLDVITVNHLYFKVMGSFTNPGLYGGYLAISFITALYLLIKSRGSTTTISLLLIISTLLLIGFALYLSDSRASWISCLIGILFLLFSLYKEYLSFVKSKLNKAVCLFLVALFISVVFCGLYIYKKDSANVRLLIWTASKEIVHDAPLLGHGIGKFSAIYMPYQGRYFEKNPDSIFKDISDNNTLAFNEFIKLTCERGLVGLFIVLYMIILVFRGDTRVIVKTILLVLLIFSCFSYPTDVFTLYVYLPLLLGLSRSRIVSKYKLNKKYYMGTICLGSFLILASGIYTYIIYNKAFCQLYKNQPVSIILQNNIEYMSIYSRRLFSEYKYEEFIDCVDNPDFPFMTSVVKSDLGRSYYQLGEIDRAASCLVEAVYMTPSKLFPQYYLFLIYKDIENIPKALEMAEKILSTPVKNKGSVFFNIRKDCIDFISTH